MKITSRALKLGNIAFENYIDDVDDDEEEDDEYDDHEEKKNANMRIVSELLKPSVEQLPLVGCCDIENIDAIEACATVTQIQLNDTAVPPSDFRPALIQRLLQTIATRNRELARFVANPQAYPHYGLLKLMRQFDLSPTGRYMLVCSFVEH